MKDRTLKIARTAIGDLWVRHKYDEHVVKEVIDEDQYRRWGEITIEPGDIVFDVGAHIGTFARLAAHYGGEVYCFEPEPDNFEMLYRNTRAVSNIHREQIAVSNSHLFLLVDDTRPELHTLIPYKTDKTIEVYYKSLDEIMRPFEYIDLLKMDIEGAEYDVLYESKTLSKVKQITMEWHHGAVKMSELIIYLETQGFKTVWLGGNGQWGHLQLKQQNLL